MSDEIRYVANLRSALVAAIARTEPERHVRRRNRVMAVAAASLVVAALTLTGVDAFRAPTTTPSTESRGAPSGESQGQGSQSGGQAAVCIEGPTLTEYVSEMSGKEFYGNVFVGSVRSVGEPTHGGIDGQPLYPPGVYTPVLFDIEFVLAWPSDVPVPSTVVVMNDTENPDRFAFEIGERYAVVAHANADGTVVTNICTPTAQVDQQDIERLRKYAL